MSTRHDHEGEPDPGSRCRASAARRGPSRRRGSVLDGRSGCACGPIGAPLVLASALAVALGCGSAPQPTEVRAAAPRGETPRPATAPGDAGETPSTGPTGQKGHQESAVGSTGPELRPISDPETTGPVPATTAARERREPLPGEVAEVTFLAVGDILLSRQVAARMVDSGDVLLPFRPLAALFRGVDFCFGNLESPFSSSDWFGRGPAHIFNAPAGHVEALVANNFALLNLANNHALDQGPAGLRFTLDLLDRSGIGTVGAAESLDRAWEGAVVERRGLRIGFLGASYASVNDDGSLRNRFVARIDDVRRIGPAVASLRERSDFVVVTMHAGAEYNPRVVPSQVAFAHAAVDAGADLVIGAHPHVVQRVEQYRGVWVLYSLGNFIFDHEPLPTRQGLAARVTVRKAAASDRVPSHEGQSATLAGLELVPVMIENRSTPRLASPEEAASILESAQVAQARLVGSLERPAGELSGDD